MKNNTKKILALLCACVMLVSVMLSTGCSPRNDSPSLNNVGNTTQNQPTEGNNPNTGATQAPDEPGDGTNVQPENPSNNNNANRPEDPENTGKPDDSGSADNTGNTGNNGNDGNEETPDVEQTPTEGDTGLKVEVSVNVSNEGNKLTGGATLAGDNVSANVPEGALLNENTSQLVLTVTQKETSSSGVQLSAGQTLLPLDVHIEGISAQNTTPITVKLASILPRALNIGNYKLYHVENGTAVEMTAVSTLADLDAHNEFVYDPADGSVTMAVASFSEIAMVSEDAVWEGEMDFTWYDANPDADIFYIRNADQLAAFGAIVGGMLNREQNSFQGKTVVLLSDIDLGDAEASNDESKIFHPIGYWNNEGTYERKPLEERETAVESGFYAFCGTFDGNGNTISNFYQNTWEIKGDHNWYDAVKEQYFRDGMGLFGKVYGGTIKNLTIKNFSSDGEITTTGVIAAYADSYAGQPAVFENITIFNCNPRVYNIGNGGIVGCAGWYSRNTDLADNEYKNAVVFRNITVDQTNKISALWGTYDVSCGGILGQYYPDSNCGLLFENCHVAAVMDVNNDVCANYQYYWYRYSGMLMGTVRANTTEDGYTVADTTGIIVSNCTYTIGDWNQYWYCELVANSLASYTHDHQFSRLTKVDSVDVENLTVTVDGVTTPIPTTGRYNYVVVVGENISENATCYHFVDGIQHNHEDAGVEAFDLNGDGELNDLKEDRVCYFIPFNQVLNGLGYGVKPTYSIDGLNHVDRDDVASEEKFDLKDGAALNYNAGETIYLKDLFDLLVDNSMLSQVSLYVAASPADKNSWVTISYNNTKDWETSYFTIDKGSYGSVKIVITDYFYCTPTVININVVPAMDQGDLGQWN